MVLQLQKKLFPHSEIKNIQIYYLLSIFNNCWFIAGNWIFFWIRFMTYGQLGIVDATAFAFGLTMEIPSGAISDLLGKKRTINLALLLLALGFLIIAFSSNLLIIWLAFLLAQLGWACYSGSAEALAFDSLVEIKKEHIYDEVATAAGTLATISTVITTLLGGLLFIIHFRLPHIAIGVTYMMGFVVSLLLREPAIDTIKFTVKGYFAQLIEGIHQLQRKNLRPFFIVILVLLGAEYLYNWGLIKPTIATQFGFFDKAQALIYASMGIAGGILLQYLPHIRKKISDTAGLYFLSILMGLGYLLSFFPLGYWGILPIILISISGIFAYPWISIVINKEISSASRATTLSTVALITKLPYVILAVVAGRMVENNTFHLFVLTVGLVIIVSILVSSFLIKNSRLRASSQ